MNTGKECASIEVSHHFCDYKGKLRVSTLCDLFNDVAEMQTVKFGVDVPTLNKNGRTWMLHRLQLQIERMPKLGETIMIRTWPSGIDRLFALRDYEVLDQAGNILIEATSEWMMIDLARRRPIRMPSEVVTMRESANCSCVSFEQKLRRDEQLEISCQLPFVATYDHIDFNGHVTQSTYVAWVTSALDFEFQLHHDLSYLEVVYEHEILPDALVEVGNRINESADLTEVYHRIGSDNSQIQHCIAYSVWKKES